MRVATVETKKSLEDPEVLAATRAYLAREERLRALVLHAEELDEQGKAGSLEGAVEGARSELDQAARELDVIAGEQLAAKLRRLKEEDMPKAGGAPAISGCRASGCREKHAAKGYCMAHYQRIKRAAIAGHGKWGDEAFERRACAGEFMGEDASKRKPKPKSSPSPKVATEARAALREAEAFEPETHGFESLQPSELSTACDALKEKLVARASLDQEIRELASKIARAAGA